jgi:hypothetical protein
MEAAAGTVATAAGGTPMEAMAMAVADIAADTGDTAADMVATTVRVTALALAFQCLCLLSVAGKPAASKLKTPKIGPEFAAG